MKILGVILLMLALVTGLISNQSGGLMKLEQEVNLVSIKDVVIVSKEKEGSVIDFIFNDKNGEVIKQTTTDNSHLYEGFTIEAESPLL